MNKETIIDQIQAYFSGETDIPDFCINAELNALQAFYIRTAKRLIIANELRKKEPKYNEDFLMAFRDFLLVFETSISVENMDIVDNNPYAIKSFLYNLNRSRD